MRDGGRQLSRGEIAVDVCKLRQALARLDLGETAPAALMEQPADQRPLDQDAAPNSRHLPTTSFPYAGLGMRDLAPRRQVALVFAPTLHLSPIVLQLRNSNPLSLN